MPGGLNLPPAERFRLLALTECKDVAKGGAMRKGIRSSLKMNALDEENGVSNTPMQRRKHPPRRVNFARFGSFYPVRMEKNSLGIDALTWHRRE
jgi:hypothetical protein